MDPNRTALSVMQRPPLRSPANSQLACFAFIIHLLFWPVKAADWPMLGRDATRNAVSPERGAPVNWDLKTGQNVKWKATLGSLTFASPVVANGLVWIGTNNDNPRDPTQTNSAGILMCFRESDGEFVYQHTSPARQGPTYYQANTGISCSPLIQGDRLWFVTTGAEVLCLDIGPLQRHVGLPTEVWKLDMMDELGVLPRRAVMGGGGLCSITAYGDLIYVMTGNGTIFGGKEVPAPFAPALLCLNTHSGKVVWEDNSPKGNILFAEWGNPMVTEIHGRAQVIAPQGDGWIRSFDARTGELIWKFDINPKDGKWPMSRGFFTTAPVLFHGRIYIALGAVATGASSAPPLKSMDPNPLATKSTNAWSRSRAPRSPTKAFSSWPGLSTRTYSRWT